MLSPSLPNTRCKTVSHVCFMKGKRSERWPFPPQPIHERYRFATVSNQNITWHVAWMFHAEFVTQKAKLQQVFRGRGEERSVKGRGSYWFECVDLKGDTSFLEKCFCTNSWWFILTVYGTLIRLMSQCRRKKLKGMDPTVFWNWIVAGSTALGR